MEGIIGFLTVALYFIIALSILVFVHEWGHYRVARAFGVKIEVFSIGFGKELIGWNDKRGVRWKISILPLGGYVKFFGDATAISNPDKYIKRISPEDREGCFHFKPLWQRALVVAAGPFINLALAVAIFFGMNMYVGQYPVVEPVVEEVTADSPADLAGIEVGDRIIEANGKTIDEFETLRFMILGSPAREMEFVIERGSETLTKQITPLENTSTDRFGNVIRTGQLGIVAQSQGWRDYTIWTAFTAGVNRVILMINGILDFLSRVFTGNASIDEVGGPVKIAQYSTLAAEAGLASFIYFLGSISVALGFMNLLPIPLLDGGHLMFYSIEAVKGRPISVRAQEMASMIGLAFVLGLFFVLTWNDLRLPGLG